MATPAPGTTGRNRRDTGEGGTSSRLRSLTVNLPRRGKPVTNGSTDGNGAAPPTPPSRNRTGAYRAGARRVGVEVDGDVVRVVDVEGGRSRFTELRGEGSFAQWARGHRSGRPTVVWTENLTVRRLALPQLPSEAMATAVTVAAEEDRHAAPGSVLAAATRSGHDAGVVATGSEALAELWPLLRKTRARVTAAPLAYPSDGLYLGVREQTNELVLVADGAPVAGRELQGGGLSQFSLQAGERVASAEWVAHTVERLNAGDPQLVDLANRWAVHVAAEVARTLDLWRRQQYSCPNEVFLHGAGAVLPTLAPALGARAGLVAQAAPRPSGVSLTGIGPVELPRAWTALCAVGLGQAPPWTFFLDPEAPHLAAAASRARSRKRLAVLVAGVTLILAALGASVLKARSDRDSARARDEAAQAELQRLAEPARIAAEVQAIEGGARRTRESDPSWSAVLGRLGESAPPGAKFTELTVTQEEQSLEVRTTVDVPGSSFVPIADWMRRLVDLGASGVTPESFSTTDDLSRATSSLVFRIPVASVRAPATPSAPAPAPAPVDEETS